MDYNKAIESLSFKFCLSVSQYDIFRWLRNFDESEWDMALNILDKVVYYSSDRIDETLECQIRNIINAHHDKNIYTSYWKDWEKWLCNGLSCKESNRKDHTQTTIP